MALPKNVIRGFLVSIGWHIIVVVMWIALEMYKSSYYSFGPSDTLFLAFTNVPINTQLKYWALMSYVVAQCAVQVYSGDTVYPWINAVVINPGVEAPENIMAAYLLTNTYWTINCFNSIFFFAIGFSQVDFALAIAITSSISGFVTSYFIVFDSERPHDKKTRARLLTDSENL